MVEGEAGFAELLSRVREGDETAFQELVNTYGPAIEREVRFTLLDARLRRFIGESDVYQSVIFRFYVRLRHGDFDIGTPSDLVGLLKGIARTRIAELVRFWHAQRRDVSLDVHDLIAPQSCGRSVIQAPVEDLLIQREVAETVRRRMSLHDQRVFEMREQGMSWADISAELNGASCEALRKQHRRELARIACELGE